MKGMANRYKRIVSAKRRPAVQPRKQAKPAPRRKRKRGVKRLLSAMFFVSMIMASSGIHAPIIVRHDVKDALSLQLGARYEDVLADLKVPSRRFPAGASGNGAGVVIGPRWVLTAAHVAAGLMEKHPAGRGDGPHSVTIDSMEYAIGEIFLHPDWTEEGPADIALIHLVNAVQGRRTVVPYERSDEIGRVITVVGWGESGTGRTGPTTMDRQLRGATNRIEAVEEDKIVFVFDPPDSMNVTRLEGISGPGDSGGPALLEEKGITYVLGVSVAQDGRGHGRGRYGAAEYYTRVSSYTRWILKMLEAHPDTLRGR